MEYLCRPRLGRTMRRLVAQLALGLALAGCTLGPDYHRATVAAPAELLASEEARHAVVMTLVSDVAAAYLQLRQLDTELETTRANVASRRGSLQLVRDRLDAGLTSALDLRQAEAELASTAAQIPDLERQIAQTEHR